MTAWLVRFSIVAVPARGDGANGVAYKLDRWTGEVTLLYGRYHVPVVLQSVPAPTKDTFIDFNKK